MRRGPRERYTYRAIDALGLMLAVILFFGVVFTLAEFLLQPF